ncbi:hypothetical protein CPT76_12595, partial [Paenibacillus sp. AR247]
MTACGHANNPTFARNLGLWMYRLFYFVDMQHVFTALERIQLPPLIDGDRRCSGDVSAWLYRHHT